MLLYLVRHGEAVSEAEDPTRPISGIGARDVNKVASFVTSNADIAVEAILHSDKMRAEQTAEILVEYVISRDGLSKVDGLAPMDDPAIWAERLKAADRDLMLVGHFPHLARITSLLLCGNPEAGIVSFQTAGIVCLKYEEGKWALQWAVAPELVK